MDIKPFDRFQELFNMCKATKKYEAELEKEALNWFKDNFNAVFGSNSRCDQKEIEFLWHYTTGLLILEVKNIGGYHYKFTVKAAMFNHLKTPSYLQGFKQVRKLKKSNEQCDRDANPYPKHDFYNRQAWDCGYICGLANKHIEPLEQ